MAPGSEVHAAPQDERRRPRACVALVEHGSSDLLTRATRYQQARRKSCPDTGHAGLADISCGALRQYLVAIRVVQMSPTNIQAEAIGMTSVCVGRSLLKSGGVERHTVGFGFRNFY